MQMNGEFPIQQKLSSSLHKQVHPYPDSGGAKETTDDWKLQQGNLVHETNGTKDSDMSMYVHNLLLLLLNHLKQTSLVTW